MHDIRLGLRNLAKRPAFTTIAVLTLALGVGANTAVFTVSNAVLLSPLPYQNPDEVVVLTESWPMEPTVPATRHNYVDWRTRAQSFTEMAAFQTTSMTLTGTGDPERLAVKRITATLLPLLGVTMQAGRNFLPEEDRAGAAGVAILSAGFAANRFAGEDPIGKSLTLNGSPFTIVGILPARFELFQPAAVYVPFWPWASQLPDDRGWHAGILPIARLKPGVSIEQARIEMDGIAKQLEAEFPESNLNCRVAVTRAQDLLVQDSRPAILMLTAAVVVVLLIACANVANLLLVRAVDRQKEIAVRIALGAGRLRIVRQLVVESVVLACIGGVAGLLVASWGVSFLTSFATGLPRAHNIAIDWRVVLFAFALAIVTGMVFGIVPALQAAQLDVHESLNEEGRGGAGGPRQRSLRHGLVVAEVGLALLLLIVAGVLLRSFATLTRVSPGFDPEHLLVANVPLSPMTYADPYARTGAIERLIADIERQPGIQAAGVTTTLPMTGSGPLIHFNRASSPPKGPDDYVMTGFRAVTPGYLATLRVPLLRGRMLTESDREGAPRVVVINETMARRFFPDRDPLGERIQLGTVPDDSPMLEIVGVVGDVKQAFDDGGQPEMFVPYGQQPVPVLGSMYLSTALVVRTTGSPELAASAIRSVVRSIDPGQPLVNMRTMRQAMAMTVAQPRFQVALLLIFGSIAAALAAVGVYGVMAYTVSQRTPEIGVRITVGASPARVVAMVVWQGAQLALMGIALGLIAAVLAAGAIQSLLFSFSGFDSLTFAVATIVLGAAALLASYIPARRASRISPIRAMGR